MSDIAYAIFVLENHSEVWKQEWRFHMDNPNASQIEKEKFHEYKKLTLSEMLDKGLSVEDRKHYLKVKPKFTHGQKKILFLRCCESTGYRVLQADSSEIDTIPPQCQETGNDFCSLEG